MRGPLYALGAFGASLLIQTVNLWLFPFYAGPEGPRAAPEAVGSALAVGRLANSAADLLVARWTDTLRTRWGRRRPFLVVGSPLLAVSFVLVWLPPEGSSAPMYLAAVLVGFFALFAAVVNPYLALLADLPLSPTDRVAAAAWQAAGNLLGTTAAYLTSGPVHTRYGYPTMAWGFAVVCVACLWLCAASVGAEPATASRASLADAARTLARSQPLRAYLAGLSLAWVGLSMVSLVLVFLVTVLVGAPAASVPAVLSGALASTAACLPVVTRWGRRAGAQAVLQACLWVAAAGLPVVSLLGQLPPGPQLGYALVVVSGLPLAALYALPNAILSDLAHHQDLQAFHFGAQGVVLNLANAVAAALVGALLRFGYTPGDDLGLRLVPLCAAAFVAAGVVAFRRLRYSWPTTPGS